MSKLTVAEVKHVAKLSNLPLEENKIEQYKQQLSAVLSYIDELRQVNIAGVEPTSQTTGLVNVTRKDEVNMLRVLGQEVATSEADNVHNGYFVVPAVIQKEHDDR